WAARRLASGPSLGRKRPRRATAAQSATAPQYMIGLIRNARDADLIFHANLQMCPSRSGTGFVCNHVNWKFFSWKSNICRVELKLALRPLGTRLRRAATRRRGMLDI